MIEAYTRLTNTLVSRVNESRGVGRRTRDALAPRQLRGQFVEAIRVAASGGLLAGVSAEASVRLAANQYLMTPRFAWLTLLDDKDLVIASTTSSLVGEDRSPTRSAWHHLLYQRVASANAVVLCQSPALMVVARRAQVPDGITSELTDVLGQIVLAPPDAVEQHIHSGNQLLISGIGLLCHGGTIEHALVRAETVELLCQATILDTKR